MRKGYLPTHSIKGIQMEYLLCQHGGGEASRAVMPSNNGVITNPYNLRPLKSVKNPGCD